MSDMKEKYKIPFHLKILHLLCRLKLISGESEVEDLVEAYNKLGEKILSELPANDLCRCDARSYEP
ncbi:hypothetical protein ES707_22137 [subsurface metagenome]